MRSPVFTPRAIRDLEDIWDYTADHWGIAQAERYIEAIRETCAALAQGTRPSQNAADIRSGYRKARSGHHVIFVRPGADAAIEVVRILHERMDLPAGLED